MKPLSLVEDGTPQVLCLEVPSSLHQQWIETHYSELVRNSLQEELGVETTLQYQIRSTTHTGMAPIAAPAMHRPAAPAPQHLTKVDKPKPPRPEVNEQYTFDQFVEGDGNRLARGAALAVARQPGSTSFNPLFIYGQVGLGKTHLAQAICNHAYNEGTAKHAVYVSSNVFTNQFITSIRTNQSKSFSDFYRSVDLLVVDDVQFLTGKERTQEEFFHLFNSLHQAGGQIVLCADRPPGEIQGVHERLISRFQWGLTADITAPDLETRVAILQRKATRLGLDIPNPVMERIAQSISTNVRDLEGVLTKLLAFSSLHGEEINEGMAEKLVGDHSRGAKPISMDQIIAAVSEAFGVESLHVVGKSRKREIVIARQAAMYIAKAITDRSLKSIGLHFAGRDHSTVIHAVRTVKDRIELDPIFRGTMEQVSRQFGSSIA